MPKSTPSPKAFPRPYTTVDVVIFTVIDDQLHVLLVKRPKSGAEPYPDRWALPGGYVDVERDKDLEGEVGRHPSRFPWIDEGYAGCLVGANIA